MNTCPMCSEQEGATAERDELRERVARLETELQQERDDAFTEAEHCQRQATRLRAALEEYGGHVGACRQMRCRSDWRCTCGLEEALTPPAAGEG